ncbi:oxidoreductase [Thalassiella azotivora]
MGLFDRFRKRSGSASVAPTSPDAGAQGGRHRAHLEEFARTRVEVEAFIEPATTVTPTTLLLVAKDGEWTRRPVPDPDRARAFARKEGVPVYDVNLSGYPSSMREYNARLKAERKAERARGGSGDGTTTG